MILVRNLKVTSLSNDAYDLTWEVEETVEDVRDYDLFVERSEGQEGPFDRISGPLVDEYLFRDVQAPQYYRNRQLYYRFHIVLRTTGEESFSEATLSQAPSDLIAVEIQRLETVMMKEYSARRVIILQRRTFGQRCHCFDTEKHRLTTRNCTECYGTGFARGYTKPMISLMQFEPSLGRASQSEHITDLGRTQTDIIGARLVVFPLLKANDLIVEVENIRWRVTGAVTYQHLRAAAAQSVTLFQIPENDIEYTVPIENFDFRTFPATPERAFTNPTNIDAVREGLRRTPA